MSGYLNSLFNTTANRVASLKQNLLPSENDGDTEDDTHVCRVLRGYYIEKGRAFPAWLPPDPRAPPPPVVIQPVYTQSVGSRYGGMQNQPGAGGGALSSLWDSQPQQPPPLQDSQSLRQRRGAPQDRLGSTRGVATRPNPFTRQHSAQESLVVEARPLPSQRAGSHQGTGSAFSRGEPQTPPGSSAGMSTREKLKAQFGNKAGSSAPRMADTVQSLQNYNNYNESSSGGSHQDDRSGRSGGNYGSGGGEKPFVAATAPWASNELEFSGGGYGSSYDSRSGGRQGLPSGPGAGRRGQGLPSGPRAPR